jgi:hypothetical protein
MTPIDTTVLYVNKDDLNQEAQFLNVNQIEWFHVKDKDAVIKAHVVILSMNGQYKVLKSRY